MLTVKLLQLLVLLEVSGCAQSLKQKAGALEKLPASIKVLRYNKGSQFYCVLAIRTLVTEIIYGLAKDNCLPNSCPEFFFYERVIMELCALETCWCALDECGCKEIWGLQRQLSPLIVSVAEWLTLVLNLCHASERDCIVFKCRIGERSKKSENKTKDSLD